MVPNNGLKVRQLTVPMLSVITLGIVKLSDTRSSAVVSLRQFVNLLPYAECHYDECCTPK
jgi:hypothetical protein